MATFTPRTTWTFNSLQSDRIGYVTAGSTAERVVSVTVRIATGNGTFRHQDADGNYTGNSTEGQGKPLTVYLKVGDAVNAPETFSNPITISNVSQSGSSREGCIAHTFIFPYPVEVPANTKWTIWFKISDDTHDSNSVLCHDYGRDSPVGVTTKGSCRISNGDGTWTTAIPWISNGDGTWTVAVPWVSQGDGTWKAGT